MPLRRGSKNRQNMEETENPAQPQHPSDKAACCAACSMSAPPGSPFTRLTKQAPTVTPKRPEPAQHHFSPLPNRDSLFSSSLFFSLAALSTRRALPLNSRPLRFRMALRAVSWSWYSQKP